MAFLCSLLLWGGVGKSLAQSIPLSSASFTLDTVSVTRQASSPSAPWLRLWSSSGSWLIPSPLASWLQPSSCSLWGEAASLFLPPFLSPSFLPSLTPVSARCLLSVKLQSSPRDRRAMLKAFSQFQEDEGGEASGGGSGNISLL